MALQKEVSIVSLTKGTPPSPGYSITLRLKCWPEGIPKTDPTVIDKSYSDYVEDGTENQTLLEVVDEYFAMQQIKMQFTIDQYLISQTLLNNPTLETRRVELEAALTG